MRSLINMLPEYYENSNLVGELQAAAQYCADFTEDYINNTRNQLSITTCDEEHLARYEKIYGVLVKENTSTDFRRANVLAKMRSTGVLTFEHLKKILSSYGCGNCSITEDIPNYKVTIEFLSLLGEPPNFEIIIELLRQLLPAHLAIEYKLLFNTWNDTSDNAYNEFSENTWNELSTMKGVK